MTKKKIYDIFSEFYKNPSRMRELTNELLEMFEQEKKETAKGILQDLKEYIAYETKPYIKWGSDNPQDELPDACINFDILNNKIDEIAKEYGVEL